MPVSKVRKKPKKRSSSGIGNSLKKIQASFDFINSMNLFFAIKEIQEITGEPKKAILERISGKTREKINKLSEPQIKLLKDELFFEGNLGFAEMIEKSFCDTDDE